MTAAAIPKDRPETMLELYRDDGPLWISIVRELGVTLD